MSWITEEWTSAWRWASTWLDALVIAAPLLYIQFQQLQPYIPTNLFLVGISIIGGLRLVNTLRKKPAPPAQ
jgi:hypothetical protein